MSMFVYLYNHVVPGNLSVTLRQSSGKLILLKNGKGRKLCAHASLARTCQIHSLIGSADLDGVMIWSRFILSFTSLQKDSWPTNNLSAGLTDICIKTLKASTAAGLSTLHHILLNPQGQVTLETAKVFFMPAHAFCLHALGGEDQLKRHKRWKLILLWARY